MSEIGNCHFKIKRDDFFLDIAFKISAEGIMGIYGNSGCGKTSILRAMAGLDRHKASQMILHDSVLQSVGVFIPAAQRKVGMVFQDLSLFPHLTVLQNIQYAAKRNRQKAQFKLADVLEILDIQPLLDRYPHALSGGQNQRVAIARTLMSEPDLLLLDEPMSALDNYRKTKLIPYLRRVHQTFKIPMIVVSHDLQVVTQLCDQLLTITQGTYQSYDSVHKAMLLNDSEQFNSHQLVSVIEAEVMERDNNFGLTTVRTVSGNKLFINGVIELARPVRLIIQAHDVVVSLTAPTDSSVLNILMGEVTAIKSGKTFDCLIKVKVEGDMFMCLISKKSAKELDLEIKQSVFIQIKTNAIKSSTGL